MRTSLIILFIFIGYSCINKKSDKSIDSYNHNLNSKSEYKPSDLKVCIESYREAFYYKQFITKEPLKFNDKLGGRLYYSATKQNFNKLFNAEALNCVIPVKGDKLNIFDLNYSSEEESEEVFFKILSIKKNPESLNAYHGFFKRGLIFILLKEKKKLLMISFNPFIDNNLPDKFRSYFKEHKDQYDHVIMTLGIGNVEKLI